LFAARAARAYRRVGLCRGSPHPRRASRLHRHLPDELAG